MKTIIKTTFAFLLFVTIASCNKENMKSPANQPTNQSSTQTANDGALVVHHIGDMFGGGIIFYIDGTGQHGLIAAPKDQSTGIRWYAGKYIVTGATGTKIGAGLNNTNKIVNAQGTTTGGYAAKLCANLVLNGFSDWYLPSKAELNQLYKHKGKVPGLAATNYWSSTEADANNAWDQEFGGGFQFADDKSFTIHVRAIRSF